MSRAGLITNEFYDVGAELLSQEFSQVRKEFCFMDLFGYDWDGDCCEIEVKLNDYDFHKEFTKPCKMAKHDHYRRARRNQSGFCPTRYYFLVPRSFRNRALSRIIREKPYYGLITYCHLNKRAVIARKSKRLTEKKFIGKVLGTPYRDNKLREL